jgi:hypothetical protein
MNTLMMRSGLAIGVVLGFAVGVVGSSFVVGTASAVQAKKAAVPKKGKHKRSDKLTYLATAKGKARGSFVKVTIDGGDVDFSANPKVSDAVHKDSSTKTIGTWRLLSTPRVTGSSGNQRLTVIFWARDDLDPIRGGTGTLTITTTDDNGNTTTTDPPITVEPVDLDPCSPD